VSIVRECGKAVSVVRQALPGSPSITFSAVDWPSSAVTVQSVRGRGAGAATAAATIRDSGTMCPSCDSTGAAAGASDRSCTAIAMPVIRHRIIVAAILGWYRIVPRIVVPPTPHLADTQQRLGTSWISTRFYDI
jgi:hypothetical protein